jgi:ribonuclease G
MSSFKPSETPSSESIWADTLQKPPLPDKAGAELAPYQLQEQARQRAKQQPVLQKIFKMIKGQSDLFRELIINADCTEKRVALLNNGILEKFEIESMGQQSLVGAIYKGRIQNLEPGLKAAFVDIGEDKNAFLHYWDILPEAGEDGSIEIVHENRTEEQRRLKEKVSLKDIPHLYPIGTPIVVQITKTQINNKGPRTTTNLALPGRYLVLMPYDGQCGISRKIEDKKERERLKKIIKKISLPPGMGIIVRTAGEGKKLRYFVRDLYLLLAKWETICKKIENSPKPSLLYQEPGLIERTVRDFLTEDVDRVLVDNEDDYQTMLELTRVISPRSQSKIQLYKDNIPIFERFGIERQIEQTFMRRVSLPSGGEIVIEETEALTAVDVNTGSHKGQNRDGKDFILQANLEAAKEVARQVMLRNIGGLIIIDFIDMKNKRDRGTVYDCMVRAMHEDKAKNHVLPISPLGIMQISRQRYKESTASSLYTACPYCQGKGTVKSARTISVQVQRKAISIIRHIREKQNKPSPVLPLQVFLHPQVLERIRTEDYSFFSDTETRHNVRFSFKSDPLFHIENFKIIHGDSGQELH